MKLFQLVHVNENQNIYFYIWFGKWSLLYQSSFNTTILHLNYIYVNYNFTYLYRSSSNIIYSPYIFYQFLYQFLSLKLIIYPILKEEQHYLLLWSRRNSEISVLKFTLIINFSIPIFILCFKIRWFLIINIIFQISIHIIFCNEIYFSYSRLKV